MLQPFETRNYLPLWAACDKAILAVPQVVRGQWVDLLDACIQIECRWLLPDLVSTVSVPQLLLLWLLGPKQSCHCHPCPRCHHLCHHQIGADTLISMLKARSSSSIAQTYDWAASWWFRFLATQRLYVVICDVQQSNVNVALSKVLALLSSAPHAYTVSTYPTHNYLLRGYLQLITSR